MNPRLWLALFLYCIAIFFTVRTLRNQRYTYRGISITPDGRRVVHPERATREEACQDVERGGSQGALERIRAWRRVTIQVEKYNRDVGWVKPPALRMRFIVLAVLALAVLIVAVVLQSHWNNVR